jgi:hypothetical protein
MNLNGVTSGKPYTGRGTASSYPYTRCVGFDPYRRVRRARMTRRGDLMFLVGFAVVIAAALLWAFL